MPQPTSTHTLPLPVWRTLRRHLNSPTWSWLYSRRELARQPLLLAMLRRHGFRRHTDNYPPAPPASPDTLELVRTVWQLLGVDKHDHGYGPVYAGIITQLRQPTAVLEIGVFEGGSLRAWTRLLPGATVLGLDIDPTVMFIEPGITTAVADQMNPASLTAAIEGHGPFDLIVDDGWHQPQANATALAVLWPHLKPGGWYVIEDIDGSRYRRFWQRVLRRLPDTLDGVYLPAGTYGPTVQDIVLIRARTQYDTLQKRQR